jgi:hypothetical protein
MDWNKSHALLCSQKTMVNNSQALVSKPMA